jgi:shikimate kinase
MDKIILVGYMAVGKSTIAHFLAKKTNFRVVDLDELIEKKLGLPIAEIFALKGEIYFRKVEHELFRETVNCNENLIIATGGGTPCYANNHLLLKGEKIVSVYLKASLGTILERLAAEKDSRPLVANKTGEELQEFVAKHLFERSYFYNQAAFTVAVDGRHPEEIAEEIIGLLN